MGTLTRDEAAHRARLLQLESYAIELDLTRGDMEFGSTTVIRFRCEQPGARTFVELKPVRLHRAVLNGDLVDPATLDANRLCLTGLATDNELIVEADMAYSRSGEGLHRFTDPVDGEVYLYAQSFLDDAQRIYACFDQPDLKARYRVSVTAPVEWTVLANGSGETLSPGRWEFAETPPLATYFVTLAAGRWHSAYQVHDEIPLGLHCRRSLADAFDPDVAELFTITRQCLDRYHEMFAKRYPFRKYDQVFVPEFNAGAMENPGCVTFRDETYVFRSAVSEAQREIRAEVIAHEMAHMWFGDLVTMRWWDDLWLNESFAEYMGNRVTAEATQFTGAWTSFCSDRKSWGYAADQRPSTHPVAADVPDAARALLNFDGISYAKGASVLRQLVTWVGDERFIAGLNDYFVEHAHGNASLPDLLESLSRHSERDLAAWARAWLTTSQVDTLRLVVSTTPDGRLADVEIEQSVPRTHPTLRPHRIAVGLYDLVGIAEGQELRRTDQMTVDLDPGVVPGDLVARTPVPSLTGRPRPALLLLNDGDLTYAKIRLDDQSWSTVRQHLCRIGDPLTRALLWAAAWDMVRDAELPVTEYLELVRDHLPTESAVSTLEAMLTRIKLIAIDRYLPPDRRQVGLGILALTCRDLLDRAVPDSSQQLVAARALAGCATDSTDLATLQAWLSGSKIPEGLSIGQDLRWSTLLRLVTTGYAGVAEIDAELTRDRSDEGRRAALRCRAALPDSSVKTDTWEAIRTDTSLSPHDLHATMQGFWQVDQADLLADYLPRYFAELPEISALRDSAEIDRILGHFGFPGYAVTSELVALAEELLASGRLSPGLVRFLSDQTDEIRRALRVQRAAPVTQPD
ncbi:MAG TPA: aminopeptidase N [Micromonosporaceae bacterium]|nr:aminopeptidase N [Micromonosporaceae bacterium]